ncbi:acyltransferase family protein [Prevotella dentasini]|uniref:acyltransferase family protein n=1 Tax=Prevotella dentasini TaxID=589537 RepID=UPI000469999D|nr:acyltransferase [Prevotella dentasini]
MKQYHELNFTRAVLILLVVLIHIVHFGNLYPETKAGILAFMMPSFLVLTGYLVNVEKTVGQFAVYLWRIFLPYLIMVVGFSVLSFFLPVRDGITELSAAILAEKVFVSAIGPYWFLYVMMGCGMVYYLSFRLLPTGKNRFARLAVFGFLLILLSLVLPLMSVQNVAYYFIGAMLRQCRCDYNSVFRPTPYALLPFVGFIFILQSRDWGSIAIVGAVCSFISFCGWVYGRLNGPLARWMDWIGMNTLPVYLFHPVFTMAGKFYLRYFDWDTTGLVFTLLTLSLSVAGSLGIALILDKTRLSLVFGRRAFIREMA